MRLAQGGGQRSSRAPVVRRPSMLARDDAASASAADETPAWQKRSRSAAKEAMAVQTSQGYYHHTHGLRVIYFGVHEPCRNHA